MIILAEISDKMATIPQMWLYWGLAGVILSALGLFHRWMAFVMFVAGFFVSVFLVWFAYQEAFLEPNFSQSVQEEMGNVWIAHSLVSSICPVVFTGIVLLWHLKKGEVALHK